MPDGPSRGDLERAVADFQAGVRREAAFEVLVRRFYRPFRSYFNKRGVPSEDLDDLVQDAFLQLYTGLDGFRGEARLSTWAFRIAYHTFCQWGRQESRKPDIEPLGEGPEGGAVEPAIDESPADEQAARRQRLDQLQEDLETLPPRMRQCLVLRAYDEMTYEEVALTMGCSVNTVKAQIFNARRRLQALERQRAAEPETGLRKEA